VFFALPHLVRSLLIIALAFLPLAGSFNRPQGKGESGSVMMGAPVPMLIDSAKARTGVASVERITLYLPSLYTNYLPYSFNALTETNLSTVFFSRDLSQWQRWQI
jgi:hypothetical protein